MLDTLAAQSGAGITGTQIFRQWWDTANAAPGAGSGGPHCDSTSNPGINRYA